MTSYQDAYTQAGINLSSNYQILRKPHIQSGWLASGTSGWSNDQLLRKRDIYRKATGSLKATNRQFDGYNFLVALMIFDDKEHAFQDFIDYYRQHGDETLRSRLQNNCKKLLQEGKFQDSTLISGSTINNMTVEYKKYNTYNFDANVNGDTFAEYFANIYGSMYTFMSEWTSPVMLGVLQCKHDSNVSVTTFRDILQHTTITVKDDMGNNISSETFINANLEIDRVEARNTTNLVYIPGDTYYPSTDYYSFIYKPVDLGYNYILDYTP